MGRPPWNHNIHYQRIVLREVPAGARRALDVGCGDGFLLRELCSTVPTVVGLDVDPASVERARVAVPEAEVVPGDVLTYLAEPFDLVASIATLHHLDTADGLRAMTRLLAPGGRLVVIGCARTELPHDLPWELAGAIEHRVLARRFGHWQHNAAIEEPTLTHRQTRAIARRELPGARYRRLAMWRYSLTWTKPVVPPSCPPPGAS